MNGLAPLALMAAILTLWIVVLIVLFLYLDQFRLLFLPN